MMPLDPGAQGENVEALLTSLRGFAELGVQQVHGVVPRVSEIVPLEILGREVVPAVAEL